MTHLAVYPQDPKEPKAGTLRVWNTVSQTWALEDASEDLVLELLAEAGADRARSAGVKAIARARLENPPAPAPKKR